MQEQNNNINTKTSLYEQLNSQPVPEGWTQEQLDSFKQIAKHLEESFGTFLIIVLPYEGKGETKATAGMLSHGHAQDISACITGYLNSHPKVALGLKINALELMLNRFNIIEGDILCQKFK